MALDTVNQRQNAYPNSANCAIPSSWAEPAVLRFDRACTATYLVNPQGTIITYGNVVAGERTMNTFIGVATGTSSDALIVRGW